MPVDKRVIEEQIKALGGVHRRVFSAREIKFLPQVLIEDEHIHGITSGFYEGRTWIVVVTNMRIIFLDKGMFFGLKQIDMPISQVSSVSHKAGFFHGEITVATSGGARTIGKITKRDVLRVSAAISGLLHKSDKPSPFRSNDFASQLERLAILREKGALTDEEFQLSKQRVMRDLC